MVSFYRVIKMGFQNFWRNRWLSVATILIMTLTILIVSFSIVLNLILTTTISLIYEKMDISVFLKDPVEAGEILKYQLTVKNEGQKPISFALEDNLSDILPYGGVEDVGAGKISGNKITWPKVTLAPGESLVKIYRVKIKPKEKWDKQAALSDNSLIILPQGLKLTKIILNESKNEQIFEDPNLGDISKVISENYEDSLEELQSRLRANIEVKEVSFVSKEEAYERFKSWYAEREELLEYIIGKNPLLASLEIKLEDPNKTENVRKILEDQNFKPLVEKVSYEEKKNQETIKSLLDITSSVKKFGLIFSLVFIFISLLIIFNTIRMNIFTRSEEIEIMQLVGASRFFVEGPFITEGLIYGFVATLISIICFYPILIFLGSKLVSYYGTSGQDLVSYFFSNIVLIAGVQLLTGILVGVFSSFLALRRYLKKI